MKPSTFCTGLLGVFCLLFSACAPQAFLSTHPAATQAIEQSLAMGFRENTIQTQWFKLYSLLRLPTEGAVQSGGAQNEAVQNKGAARKAARSLHVYIEGDGMAWLTRTRISPDPTPTVATALHVAEKDPAPHAAVLYLARPCQYLNDSKDPMCNNKYWSSHRLSVEVIAALNEAVSVVKNQVGADDVVLVGYSGGGAAAALVAAQRNDVRFLGSIAGNLDIKAWTSHHRITPLTGSMDPMDYAHKVQHLAQRHLSSPNDAIVPPHISKNFCEKIKNPAACVQVPDVWHGGEWENVWNYSYATL